jgi:phosphoribosyl 1,2-cyclic phosphate phosphodiesterase
VKITLLGTGTSQGVPMIGCDCKVCQSKDKKDKRLRSSVLVEHLDTTIVIDAGPDFRFQMLRAGVRNLDAVLLTHEHYDHVAGLDDVRAFNKIRKGDVDVYAEKRVLTELEHNLHYAFKENKYPGVPSIRNNEICDNSSFSVGDITIVPLRVLHHKLPVLGYRVGDFAYITDANFLPDSTVEKLNGVKVLVINALRIEPHISHFNLAEALDVIARINPDRAILTHISHRLGLYAEIVKILPDTVEPGYDQMVIEV